MSVRFLVGYADLFRRKVSVQTLRKAFTIVELLVVVAIIALLIAILLPAITKAREAALTTQSAGNMKNMSTANASYGADWSDRQFTAVPDDWGTAPGVGVAKCIYYQNNIACPPQQILGWDSNGGLWGYWIGGGLCPGSFPSTCAQNGTVLYPLEWTGPNQYFGSWRMPNVKAFNDQLNGRFYDKIFWAPKDRMTLERATPGLQNSGEFSILPNIPL
ncbi:MAG: prepilin-type N-terminal cleavage/methylation domain-containing protein, partial [Phycisphaerales bacterium]|nr:prepilin-type N-terminal cleavage/methylation domain-containing protein [Phycisphaerales bacterium]